MGKQRCGSCRFFEDAGLAGNGWCHHPLRKTTSDLLILVRRNELACRDAWEHCLWEGGTWSREAVPATAAALGPGRRVAPASEGEIAALLQTSLGGQLGGAAEMMAEDVVLGEARLVHDQTPPWRRDEPMPPPPRDRDARAALRRAHEAHKERRRAETKEQAALAVPVMASTATEAFGVNEALVAGATGDDGQGVEIELGTTDREPTLVGVDDSTADNRASTESEWLEEDQPTTATTVSSATTTESSVPVAVAVQSPAAEDDLASPIEDRTRPAAGDTALWWRPEPDAAAAGGHDGDWDFASEPADDPGRTNDSLAWSGPGTPAASDADYAGQATTAAFPATSPWSVASAGIDPAECEPTENEIVDWWDGRSGDGPPPFDWNDHDPFSREARRDPADWQDARDDGDLSIALPNLPPAGSENASALGVDHLLAASLGETEAPAAARPVIALLPAGAVAPGVPRICRTCRDFRPVDGGDGGWCANEWAFAARRVVQPDDAAPCESSIGSWWLPTDELCLTDADVSSHGQPTPALDRWLPDHRERAVERKQS